MWYKTEVADKLKKKRIIKWQDQKYTISRRKK